MTDLTTVLGRAGAMNSLSTSYHTPANHYSSNTGLESDRLTTTSFQNRSSASLAALSTNNPAPASQPTLSWRNSATGQNAMWFMNGTSTSGTGFVNTINDPNWQLEASGDLNGDGKDELILRNYATGQNAIWQMNGNTIAASAFAPTVSDLNWRIEAAGDLNGDGRDELIWRNYATGQNAIWQMNGSTLVSGAFVVSVGDLNWGIAGAADFNNDGKGDLVWRNYATGQNAVWHMNGSSLTSSAFLAPVTDRNWQLVVSEGISAPVTQPPSIVSQLTNNTVNDRNVRTSGNFISWERFDGNDWEVMLWDGQREYQLTNNDVDDYNVQMDNNRVVWQRRVSNDNHDIFLWNGNQVIGLATSAANEINPYVSGNKAVWNVFDGNDWEIGYYDGQNSSILTNNTVIDRNVRISGNNVVWERSTPIPNSPFEESSIEIFLYDGTNPPRRIVDVGVNVFVNSLTLSGNTVAWQQGNEFVSYSITANQTTPIGRAIPDNNGYANSILDVSGSNVISSGVGGQLNLWSNGQSRTITTAAQSALFAQISGSKVVWFGTEQGMNGVGLYVHENGSTRRVAEVAPGMGGIYGFDYNGNYVTWERYMNNEDSEVYYARV